MKIKIFLLGFTLWVGWFGYAQPILINPAGQAASTLDAEDLTVEVLINGGECSTISNFQKKDNNAAPFPSPNRSWGYFEKGNSNFPFEKGIVLTSGYAKDAPGPTGGIVSQGDYGWTGDPQANVLAQSSTNNATVFEFDFQPMGDHISFNYIFASEEYPDFACSSYNDVFGFIISGPGIVNDPGLNGKNIALLPNGLPVTINNVNDDYCGDINYYVAGPFQDIQYGGRTVVLTAESDVVPGELYHIRLLVADSTDTLYDSAVFLEAGSFNLGSTLSDEGGAELGTDISLCDQTSFTIVAQVDVPNASFQWYKDGVLIPGATNANYTATEDGYYSVVITSDLCQTEVGINIAFNDSPVVAAYETLVCSPTGTFEFDLSDYDSLISTSDGISFSYYNTLAGAQAADPNDRIMNFQNFPVNTGTTVVYVRVQTATNCFEVAELMLQVGIGPETTAVEYALCDDDGDGFMSFDLTTQNDALVLSDPNGLIYEYYLDAALTQAVPNPADFTNTTSPQVIYVKIYNPETGGEACASVETLTLVVNEFPAIQPFETTVCNNLHDNSEIVDLTQNDIVITPGIQVSLHYFETIGGTEIADPANYEMTASPTVIHVLVRNNDGTCDDYQTITINWMESPDATDDIVLIENCSLTEFTEFDLSVANEDLVQDVTGLTFSYHLNFNDAYAGINPLPEIYQNTSPNQIIFVRILNADGCFDIARIQLTTVLKHEVLQDILTVCDDPYVVSDGIAVFDISLLHDDIENILGGTNYTIQYFTSLDDAVNGTNSIQNPSNFQNTVNPQTIYAQASSGEGGCAGVVDFQIEVMAVPEFELPANVTFCESDFEKIFEFDGDFETYTWFDPNGAIVGNESSINFLQPGVYTLEVTETGFECPARREIEVIFDNPPVILSIEVNGHQVTVSAAGGEVPFKYSIDNGLSWSDSNVFPNLEAGLYEMLVRSKYGCISEAKSFGVLGAPNFISPNGDGRNDYWSVRGLDAYPNTHIKIFDRYGKLFVDRILDNNFAWDGRYKGDPVASGDYWYIIILEDGRKLSGHITVRNY